MASSTAAPPAVLIADDVEEVADVIRVAIEMVVGPDAVRVLTAGDGAESIDLAKRHHPTLAVLDIAMPQCNGITAAFAIRQDCAPLTILGISGSVEEVITARLSGAFDDVWMKPLDVARLEPHLWRALREACSATR